MAKVSWIKRKRKEPAKSSSRSLGLLPCPVCHELPNLRFWGDSDYYLECHIARKPLAPQEHFPTVQEAGNEWNKDVRYIKKILQDVDAVSVVRCRDCVKRGTGECPMEQDYPWISTESDAFCSQGERRDDNDGEP